MPAAAVFLAKNIYLRKICLKSTQIECWCLITIADWIRQLPKYLVPYAQNFFHLTQVMLLAKVITCGGCSKIWYSQKI